MLRLKSYEFRRERERIWRELEELLARADQGGVRGLSGADLARLPMLYQSALSSLSVARAISLDRNVVDYLEGLAARAHFAVYGVRQHLRDAVRRFALERFPRAVRRLRAHLCLAALFLALGAATAVLQVARDPERFHAFVADEYAQGRDPSATTEELRDALEYNAGGAEAQLAAFSSFLFSHNARIGMLSFALGFAAGLPVFLLTFTNGLLLGAFAALYGSRGLSVPFWGWLLPHGVTEILALLLCAAGGLAIAESLVFPGPHTRLRNLALRGREAGEVVVGAVAMFLIAGCIEGIFRQLVHSTPIRYTVAISSAALWILYFSLAGRKK
jgi:uncharacterized membrane protein SpoIIM required for sporulation